MPRFSADARQIPAGETRQEAKETFGVTLRQSVSNVCFESGPKVCHGCLLDGERYERVLPLMAELHCDAVVVARYDVPSSSVPSIGRRCSTHWGPVPSCPRSRSGRMTQPLSSTRRDAGSTEGCGWNPAEDRLPRQRRQQLDPWGHR